MRALAPLLTLLLSTTSFADPLAVTSRDGAPAIQGDGTSSTTVSVIGGAASVTLDATGSIGVYTDSGTVDASGSIGVPQLGVQLGGGVANGGSNAGAGQGGNASAATQSQAAAGTKEAGIDTSGNAAFKLSDADVAELCSEVSAFDSTTTEALALVVDQQNVQVIPMCADGSKLPRSLMRAVEQNAALRAALAASGYASTDVVDAKSPVEGTAILLVRQS